MSCQLLLSATFDDINKIRKYLFSENIIAQDALQKPHSTTGKRKQSLIMGSVVVTMDGVKL